jgi:hypothetical protein
VPIVNTDLAVLSLPEGPGYDAPWEPMPDAGPIESPSVGPVRFLKDVASVGDYIHPVQKWKLSLDRERMDKHCAAFAAMKADGIKVPIYKDHVASTDSTLGYVADIFRGGDQTALARWPGLAKLPPEKLPADPDRIYAVHEFPDAACAQQACRVGQVSMFLDKDFTGGNGKKYGEAIRHVAITPEPVIGGQDGFVHLAASRTQPVTGEAPVYVLSRRGNQQRLMEQAMKPEQLKKLADLLPEADRAGVTEENVFEKVGSAFSVLNKSAGDLQKKATDLDAQLQAATKKMAASTISEDVLDQLAEGAEEAIDGLACGATPKISPAVAKDLKGLLIGDAGRRNTYALSRHVSGTPESLLKGIVRILRTNDIVKLGEDTHAQAVALSRIVPGAKPDDTPDPKLQGEMAAVAGSAAGAAKK